MEALTDALLVNLPELLLPVIGVIFSIVGGVLASLLWKLFQKEKVQTFLKKLEANKEVVEASVKYVESVGKTWKSQEKFNTAKERAIKELEKQGMKTTEDQLDNLIEGAVLGLKTSFLEVWNEESNSVPQEKARELTEEETEKLEDRK